MEATPRDPSPPSKESVPSKPTSESTSVATPTTSLPTYESHLPQGESISVAFASGSGANGMGSGALGGAEPFSIFGPTPTRSIFDPDEPVSRPQRERVFHLLLIILCREISFVLFFVFFFLAHDCRRDCWN